MMRTSARWAWGCLAFAAVASALLSASVLPFDIDEFQHLHIAWNLREGRWPYRDFYEHHGLVLTLVNGAVLALRGKEAASLDSLVWMRWVSCAALQGQALVVHRVARRWSRTSVAPLMG